MTRAEIIYQRRIAVLDHADRVGNVAEACRVFGISRTRYYEWKGVADRYGLAALMPKERRAPQMPEATPTHVVEALLTLAVLEPTIGCRQYADRLGDEGFSIAKSTAQKHLVAHGLGKRSQRLARAAAIAAATTGLVTEAARDDEPFGFCLASGGPGELVCLDSFYIGKLKGVGKVYQLTAIDVFTRWAFVAIVLGPPNGTMTARFIDQVLRAYRRHGVRVRADSQRQRSRVHRQRLHRRPGSEEHHPPPHPTPLAEPQRRGRALPRHHPPRVLAPRLPSPSLHLDPPAPGRSRCLAHRPTTAADATTATTCAVGPLKRSSTTTSETRQHDNHQPQWPSVTSTPGPEALDGASSECEKADDGRGAVRSGLLGVEDSRCPEVGADHLVTDF